MDRRRLALTVRLPVEHLIAVASVCCGRGSVGPTSSGNMVPPDWRAIRSRFTSSASVSLVLPPELRVVHKARSAARASAGVERVSADSGWRATAWAGERDGRASNPAAGNVLVCFDVDLADWLEGDLIALRRQSGLAGDRASRDGVIAREHHRGARQPRGSDDRVAAPDRNVELSGSTGTHGRHRQGPTLPPDDGRRPIRSGRARRVSALALRARAARQRHYAGTPTGTTDSQST